MLQFFLIPNLNMISLEKTLLNILLYSFSSLIEVQIMIFLYLESHVARDMAISGFKARSLMNFVMLFTQIWTTITPQG